MGSQLRIVYMGTPDFAVAGLKALVENKYNVVAVITMPDKPAGRGHQIQHSPVKQYALEQGIDVLQPEKLKDPDFVEQLRSYHADLQIVVAFRMLPEVVWTMPRLGTFNLHASLLPQYRGAAPINWAVMNGDKETGVTTFMLKHEIDTGDMILQERIAIGEDENVGSVHDRLMELGTGLILKTVDLIEKSDREGTPIPTTPQPVMEDLRPAPKIFKETCKIDFTKTANEIHNFVRGLSPYPCAWANLTINGVVYENVKVFRVTPYPTLNSKLSNQTASLHFKLSTLNFPCADGYISIDELQLPGKKRMDAKALLNGLRAH
mgnify:FL=1